MPEEWLTYREIGARLGLNVEAVRTRVRRAGWRTQPGNDGRTRVLVPDRVLVEPVEHDGEGVNRGVNRAHDLTGLVTLLTAAEARISRLEKQVEDERDRINEARSEADRLRTEVAHLTARADRAEQTSTLASAACKEATEIAGELRRDLDAARVIAGAAQHDAQEAAQAAAALRQAEAARKARGRLRRAWDGWRGR
jgi:hypothetical protein